MNTYTAFNVVLLILVTATLLFLVRSRAQLGVIIQTAAYITVLSFPWDHFAIVHGAWTYTTPGVRLFEVPLNDMFFIFTGSLLSAGVLSGTGIGREAEAKAENSGDESPRHEID
jgi:lycopene cyclase domain-containing protein